MSVNTVNPFDVKALSVGINEVFTASTKPEPTNVDAAAINAVNTLSLAPVVSPKLPLSNSTATSNTENVLNALTHLQTQDVSSDKIRSFLNQLNTQLPQAVREPELNHLLAQLKSGNTTPEAFKANLETTINSLQTKLNNAVANNDEKKSLSLLVQMLLLLLTLALESRESNKLLREVNVAAVVNTITNQAQKLQTQAIATAITAGLTFFISIASAALTFKSAGQSKQAAKEGIDIRKNQQELSQTQKIATRSDTNSKAHFDKTIEQQQQHIQQRSDVKDVLTNKAQGSNARAQGIAAAGQSVNLASNSANSFVEAQRKLDEADTQKQQNEQTKASENRDYFEKLLAQVLDLLKQVLGSESQAFKSIASKV